MRILFVSAKPKVDFSTFYIPLTPFWARLYTWGIRWVTGLSRWRVAPHTSAVLANRNITLDALANICHPDHDVDVHDEFFGQLRPEDCLGYDLVGISIFTATARRGYALADGLRARGPCPPSLDGVCGRAAQSCVLAQRPPQRRPAKATTRLEPTDPRSVVHELRARLVKFRFAQHGFH